VRSKDHAKNGQHAPGDDDDKDGDGDDQDQDEPEDHVGEESDRVKLVRSKDLAKLVRSKDHAKHGQHAPGDDDKDGDGADDKDQDDMDDDKAADKGDDKDEDADALVELVRSKDHAKNGQHAPGDDDDKDGDGDDQDQNDEEAAQDDPQAAQDDDGKASNGTDQDAAPTGDKVKLVRSKDHAKNGQHARGDDDDDGEAAEDDPIKNTEAARDDSGKAFDGGDQDAAPSGDEALIARAEDTKKVQESKKRTVADPNTVPQKSTKTIESQGDSANVPDSTRNSAQGNLNRNPPRLIRADKI